MRERERTTKDGSKKKNQHFIYDERCVRSLQKYDAYVNAMIMLAQQGKNVQQNEEDVKSQIIKIMRTARREKETNKHKCQCLTNHIHRMMLFLDEECVPEALLLVNMLLCVVDVDCQSIREHEALKQTFEYISTSSSAQKKDVTTL